jgi:methyl-accepting chemotaxis protein
MALLLACAGCGLFKKTEQPILASGGQGRVDLLALRYDLNRFGDRAFASIVGTADAVAAATQDRAVRELTLRWKIRSADMVASLASDPDPRAAFVVAWVMLEQDRQQIAQGDAGEVLGDQAEAFVSLLDSALSELVAIGQRHFGEEAMSRAEEQISALAADPDSAGQVLGRLAGTTERAPTDDKGERGAVMTLLSAPVAAVSSLHGVSDTPTAVNNVAAAVVAFGGMAKQLPERARWEMEMLLLNAGYQELMADLRANVDRVGAAAESMAKTAEQLPASLRAETELLVSSLDESQPQLQQTLAGAQETVDGVTVAIGKADELVKTVDATVQEIAVAAEALQSTAQSIQALVAEVKGPPDAEPKPEPEGEPVTIGQVTELADKVDGIVDELRLLVADLKEPMPEAGAVNQAAVRIEALIDRATWRFIAVIAALLVAALIYKLAGRAIVKRSPAEVA